MGGWRSGRWRRHDKATTVEECFRLGISRWMGLWLLRPQDRRAGEWHLYFRRSGSYRYETLSVGWEVPTGEDDDWLRLSYDLLRTGERVVQLVELITTRPYFGGLRWWFRCPYGGECNRRVGKLYLPPGARLFGCRTCHGLTYASCQNSHKVGFWTRLGRFLDKVEKARESR